MNQSVMGVRAALNDIYDPEFRSSHSYFAWISAALSDLVNDNFSLIILALALLITH